MGRPKVAARLTAVDEADESLLLGLQALADPVRLRMVRLLAEQEQCICHLTEAFGLSQASISHHMAVLKRADLVDVRRDARWTYYRLSPDAFSSLRQSLDGLLEIAESGLAARDCCGSPAEDPQGRDPAARDLSTPSPLVARPKVTALRWTRSRRRCQ